MRVRNKYFGQHAYVKFNRSWFKRAFLTLIRNATNAIFFGHTAVWERDGQTEQERRKLGRGRLRNRAKHMRDKTQLSILHHLYLCGKFFASASLLREKHLPQWSKKDRRCKSGRFAICGYTPSALDWVLWQNEGSEADKTAFPARCASQPFIQYWPSEGHVESNATKHDRYTQTTRTTHMHACIIFTYYLLSRWAR